MRGTCRGSVAWAGAVAADSRGGRGELWTTWLVCHGGNHEPVSAHPVPRWFSGNCRCTQQEGPTSLCLAVVARLPQAQAAGDGAAPGAQHRSQSGPVGEPGYPSAAGRVTSPAPGWHQHCGTQTCCSLGGLPGSGHSLAKRGAASCGWEGVVHPPAAQGCWRLSFRLVSALGCCSAQKQKEIQTLGGLGALWLIQ